MNRIKKLSESDFLKLLFGFLSVAFLIASLFVPDRERIFTGLWDIAANPGKSSTNYFAVGGYAATFLNVALVGAIFTTIFCLTGAKANNVSTLAVILTLGFCFWGINWLNIWPTVLGVALYCLVKKEKLGANVNAMLFSTGIAPLITDLMVRYPSAEVVGFNLYGVLVALLVGLAIGFFLPAGLAFSPKVHKGFDLYSAALPVGMTAFFLNAILYKTMGLDVGILAGSGTLDVASATVVNVFCGVLFGVCIVVALLLGCKVKDYCALLCAPEGVGNVSGTCGNAVFLMNLGVFGLFILAYYNIIGASFNGVTMGVVFCMLATCNSGSNPATVFPIIVGYAVASLLSSLLSGVVGGNFTYYLNAQAIVVGLCFANGLSPVTAKYGAGYGILAGALHYFLVTSVPNLHGGFCLYNGGLTAALVCIVLIPQLERFAKTKAERKALKT